MPNSERQQPSSVADRRVDRGGQFALLHGVWPLGSGHIGGPCEWPDGPQASHAPTARRRPEAVEVAVAERSGEPRAPTPRPLSAVGGCLRSA